MEGYPRGPELSRETLEVLKTPEQIFDSDREKAEKEAEKVAERLRRMREKQKQGRGIEVDIEAKIGGSLAKINSSYLGRLARSTRNYVELGPHYRGKRP